MSIQLRTILVLNLFVACLATVMLLVSRESAGQVVEERLASEMSLGVSAFLQSKSFPLNDTMLEYLRDIFHTDWAVSDSEGSQLRGTSLPTVVAGELRKQLQFARINGRAMLDGRLYRVLSQSIVRKDAGDGEPDAHYLLMLVPDAQLEEARHEAATRMFKVFLPALIVATLVAWILSFTITRPIRRLVKEMDELAAKADGEIMASPREPTSKGAVEIVRLTNSFRHLLGRLAAARESLARHERLATLGKVSVSVAHEMRNPLSGIKMNVRVLQDELAPGEGNDLLNAIGREIDRMDLYLQELMNLSKGTSAPEATPVQLKLSILNDEVLTILAGRCRHARITVEREYARDEPWVWADANAVRQCMMNLLVNGIEAMPSGGNLCVAIMAIANGARFSVRDSGGGVKCAAGQDIFDAFVSGKPGGVGLGLYLAREAIMRNGGRISYESNSNGSTFWLELPIQEGKAGDIDVKVRPFSGETVRAT